MALGRGREKEGEGWSTVPSSLSCQAGNAYNIGLTCSFVAVSTPVSVPVPIHVPVAVPASVHVLVPKSSAGTELKTWLGKVSHAKSINEKKTRTETFPIRHLSTYIPKCNWGFQQRSRNITNVHVLFVFIRLLNYVRFVELLVVALPGGPLDRIFWDPQCCSPFGLGSSNLNPSAKAKTAFDEPARNSNN